MNCPEVRAALPEFIYGGLTAEMNTEVERHLAGCPDCRLEDAALRRVRGLLTAAPDVRVDAATIYRQAAERQARRTRRWRRVVVAACAAAVLVAALFGLSRLEIRVGASEMVVRWGVPPAAPVTPPALPAPPPAADAPKAPPAPAAVDDARIAAMEDRLHTLSELVQALADDGRDRDAQRGQEIAHLRKQLRECQGLFAERFGAMQKDFDALYIAYFPSRKGANP